MSDLLQGSPSVVRRQNDKPSSFEYLCQGIDDEWLIVNKQHAGALIWEAAAERAEFASKYGLDICL